LLGHQQSFGEEEIISNCDRRITRAVVVSQAATIFAIPTEVINLLNKFKYIFRNLLRMHQILAGFMKLYPIEM